MLSALSSVGFRYLLVGNLTTSIGHWSQQIGKGWLVFQLTDSTLHLGLVTFAQGVPMFFTTPIAGVLSDRFDRKLIVWFSQALLAVLAFTMAFLVMTDSVEIWHVYVIAIISGTQFGINSPPRQAMVYDLVGKEHLHNAVAMNSMAQHGTRVLGPSLAGLLIGTVGTEGAFFLQAGAYGMALLSLIKIPRSVRMEVANERSGFFENMMDGVRYARERGTLMAIILCAFVAAIIAWPHMHLMPAYAENLLGLKGDGFGYLMTASGAGALMGTAGLMVLGDFRGRGRALAASLCGLGFGIIVLGVFTALPIAVVFVCLVGVTSAVQMTLSSTLLQLGVDDDRYRGRVTALYFQGWGLTPIGSLVAGALAEWVDLQVTFVVLGSVVIASVGFIWLRYPGFRRL